MVTLKGGAKINKAQFHGLWFGKDLPRNVRIL